MDAGFREGFVDSRLIRSERSATLQREDDAFKGKVSFGTGDGRELNVHCVDSFSLSATLFIASQLSEVEPRRSSHSAGFARKFELCHYDQATDDPQAAVLSCALAPRSILNEIEQRDLLNRRITGYAHGWSALTFGLVRCAKPSGLTLEAQGVWIPLVASWQGLTSRSLLRPGSFKKGDTHRRQPCLDY